jgi:2-methylcitrate dehydratase
MTIVQKMAAFIQRAALDELSEKAREQIKIRILDSLGVAIGALGAGPIQSLRLHIDDFGRSAHCALIGGGRTSPDFAALYNSALVRYLDFNDSYLAVGETCHPSDNIAAIMAAGEYARISGTHFMLAVAVSYQVHCRLSDEAPVRAKGFDHTTQGAYAVAAGVSKALQLDIDRAACALSLSGAPLNALRVTRTGALSHWKGLAYPYTAFAALSSAFLAMRGITGPMEVFEGNKGFQESISGKFHIEWEKENLERVNATILKKFNAEIHSQTILEGAIDLMKAHAFKPEEIRKIEIRTFDVAYHIIGGGEEGNKKLVRTKEEADHSLHYMTAVALLDSQVLPEQYRPERIRKTDVQELLQKIEVTPSESYSREFPGKMPGRLKIYLQDGRILEIEKHDYHGFHTRPMNWETVRHKFEELTLPFTDQSLRSAIMDTVFALERHSLGDLTQLLARVRSSDSE